MTGLACLAPSAPLASEATIALGVAGALVLVLLHVSRLRPFPGRLAFLVAVTALIAWLGAVAMELQSPGAACKVFWAQAAWPAISLLPTAWALFLADFARGSHRRFPGRKCALYALGPVAIAAAAFTNGEHGLFYGPGTRLTEVDGLSVVMYDHGPLFFAAASYLYLFMLVSIGTALAGLIRAHPAYRVFFAAMLAVTLAPAGVNVAYVLGGFTLRGFDPTPFTFSVAVVVFAWLITTRRLFDIVSIAKDMLFHGTRNPVVVMNAGGRVEAANDEARTLFADAVLPGRDLADCPRLGAVATSCLAPDRQPPATVEFDARAFEPRTTPIASALRGDQPVIGWAIMLFDITERRRAEEKLRRTAEHAEAANRTKSRFLANMSHEIRTPLNGVLGMAEMLERAVTDAEHLAMARTIRRSGTMLLALLDDILDVSKIEAGKLALETVALVPGEIAADIVRLHRPNAESKGVVLALDAETGADLPRLGDPHRIMQILHNLVSNAVKFTDSGSVRVTMAEGEGPALRIEVADTGIGMSPEQLSLVFEDFAQADGSITRRYGGTGLGMSIVRRLVEMMGGTIEVESALDVGTRVRVTLPLPRAVAQGDGAGDRGTPAGPAPLAGLRLLAADDSATNRAVLGAMLRGSGAETTLVGGGREAVNTWAPGAFDVVLLDIAMPDLDGIATRAAIAARAADSGLAAPPMLAITANVMPAQVEEYRAAGFAGHVGKPLRRDELFTAISRVAERPGMAA